MEARNKFSHLGNSHDYNDPTRNNSICAAILSTAGALRLHCLCETSDARDVGVSNGIFIVTTNATTAGERLAKLGIHLSEVPAPNSLAKSGCLDALQ
jgi:hypothetical protein